MIVFSKIKQALFLPPYRSLPLAVFSFLALCFILHPQGALQTFALSDTDSYMRMNQVMNWLSGQSWYDLS
ncbi:MAG: hypothetical protein PHX43_08090, partial [Alphaproteobacteria bacterium]|nr:hypothetical protein [Alphaproteobacteria bacterium]